MSFTRLSKVHTGRFKNTSWQDSISGMLLRWREGEKNNYRVKDWRWSSIPACHCFHITLLEFLVESGAKMEMKNHGCTMKKRAKYPMWLVIRRQSRINSRFADKPLKTFPSPLFPSISCTRVLLQ